MDVEDLLTGNALRAAMAKTTAQKRPDLAELYEKLAAVSEQTPDYSGVQRVMEGADRRAGQNFANGLALSMFGGKTARPVGQQLTESGLRPAQRPNVSDAGYVNPQTGEFVENPAMRSGRTEKSLLAQITAGERAEQAAATRASNESIAAENRAMREAIAKGANQTRIYLGDQRAATKGGLTNSERKEQADLAQQLNAVDLALQATELAPTAFGKMRGIPGGVAGQFGESIMGTMDSDDETFARSQVFNVMSSIIKARAGTAQSAHELRTLNGFLPSPYDDATQVKNKMSGFKKFLEGQKESHLQSVTGGKGRGATGSFDAPAPAAKPAAAPTVDFNSLR